MRGRLDVRFRLLRVRSPLRVRARTASPRQPEGIFIGFALIVWRFLDRPFPETLVARLAEVDHCYMRPQMAFARLVWVFGEIITSENSAIWDAGDVLVGKKYLATIETAGVYFGPSPGPQEWCS